MAIRKVFVSRTGVELAVRTLPENAEKSEKSEKSEMFLEIKDGDTILFVYFDEEDHADLIRELQKIKKQIAK